MKNIFLSAILTALVVSALPIAHAQGLSPRQHLLLDAHWRFKASLSNMSDASEINNWRWMADSNGPTDAATMAAPGLNDSGAGWQNAAPSEDVFHGVKGYAWFRTTLPNIPGPQRTIRLGVDDNGDVYLNGIKLVHHQGYGSQFSVPLDSAWNAKGPNVLAVLVQNDAGPGGIIGPIVFGNKAPKTLPLQTDFNDAAWKVVHLPNDYIVAGKFTKTVSASFAALPVYPAWYRKSFVIPAADKGKDLWVTFDGVYRDAKVWMNGVFLGEHQSGYIGFRYDISKDANYGGVNTLAVHVDPTMHEGWWYEGGGIYRHVWLNVANPLHVAPWGTYVIAHVKNVLTNPSAALTIQTTFANTGKAQECRVISQVFGPNGKEVASVTTPVFVLSGSQTINQTAQVAHAALWSLQKTNMYRLHTELVQGTKVIDAVDTPFGIRTIRFDPNSGFYLDGKHVEIKGVCNHQDFAGVGIGVPDSLEYWRVAQLKKYGVNGWRMSHNPPTPSLLDACDQEGMVVMDENRHLGDTYAPKSSHGVPYSNLSDLGDMILRDRNHPSIIMWSLCNEEMNLQAKPEGARILQAMMNKVHEYDTTRPITCAMNGGFISPGFPTVEDLIGMNYNPAMYAQVHQTYPTKPIFGSETSSMVSTRGEYAMHVFTFKHGPFYGKPSMGWVSSYDVNAPYWGQTAEGAWAPIATHPFVAGGFDWTGFDYKGEPTPFGWPDINSNFGMLDECGFPKDIAYYYKAWWTSKPVIHILPHWNWPSKLGQPISVWVYSNAARVTLFLNGKSLGSQTMPKYGHVQWSVPYAPGTLLAKGYDAAGKVIGSDTVATAGAPTALRLTTGRRVLAADGEDVTVVDVAVVDSKGRVVPTASNLVTFRVTGAGHIAGVGNGDPSDHDPDQADDRLAFNGRCMVLVGAGSKPGPIALTASSPGLKPAHLALKSYTLPYSIDGNAAGMKAFMTNSISYFSK